MKFTVPLALFGWPMAALLLFWVLRPRRAVIASLILAWLLLPVAGYKFFGAPAYNKIVATSLGALLGVLFFDPQRLLAFRPGWRDLPMAIWCVCPFFSSLSNDLGFYDGTVAVFYQSVTWAIPYVLGRIYISDLIGVIDLATGIFLGGLLYIPLCLLEIRLSPQLNLWVYGFYQHSFLQTIRYGGYRPMVFMDHGIMVAMWMAMASLAGLWLWYSRTLRLLFRIPLPWLLIPLVVTTLLCKSLGAITLMVVGAAVLLGTRVRKTRALVIALALVAPIYFAVRLPGLWSGDALTEASAMISPERASSIQFRLDNEEALLKRARMRPLFGWGGWGRARIHDASSRDISVTDGLWIITVGNNGLVGLGSLLGLFLMPLVGLCRAFPVSTWRHGLVAPAVALCVIVLLFLVDCIFNAMNNPIYTLAAGGLAYLRMGNVKKVAHAAPPAEEAQWSPQS